MDSATTLMFVLWFVAGVVFGAALMYFGPILIEAIDEKIDECENREAKNE